MNDIEDFHYKALFIGVPSSGDMGDKIALVCLTVKLFTELRMKKPDVTLYQVLKLCVGKGTSYDELINDIAILCKEFMYGCEKFPDMGVPTKEIPAKIKELINGLLPF